MDYVDLNDRSAGIIGGHQTNYATSLIWSPEDYAKFIIQYGYSDIDDGNLLEREIFGINEGISSFGIRAQVDW